MRQRIASAKAPVLCGGTTMPVSPERTSSGTPPTPVATTGTAAAIASRMTFGDPSHADDEHEPVGGTQQIRDIGSATEKPNRRIDPQFRGEGLERPAQRTVTRNREGRPQRGKTRQSSEE